MDHWSKDMLSFDSLEKGLAIDFLPHFVYDFSRKMFLIFYSIDWLNFTVWLPLLLEILINMCIAIAFLSSLWRHKYWDESWTLTFKNFFVICLIESSLKMMKNAFYFILKALFVLKIFKVLWGLFHHVQKTAWLER